MEDAVLDSGTADLSGGVGNGQATGTGQVSEKFDIESAVGAIGNSLGFGKSEEPAKPAAEAIPPAAAESPAAKPSTPAVPDPSDPTAIAPKTWKPEEAAAWAAIPPSAKAAIARREEEMFKGIEGYKQTAQFGTAVQNILAPYSQLLQGTGIQPLQNVQNLLQVQKTLTTGSLEQRTATFRELARDFGIDLMGQGAESVSDAYIDPQIKMLQEELAQVRAGQSSLQQTRYQEVQLKTQNEVNAFASDLNHPHFDAVADEVAKLLMIDRGMSLAKAYETAVWSNPATRAQEIAKQVTADQAKASADAAKKLAETKHAMAANVRVQPKAGAATLPLGTMADTMAETLAAIKNRSN